jgi:hypothetical protein
MNIEERCCSEAGMHPSLRLVAIAWVCVLACAALRGAEEAAKEPKLEGAPLSHWLQQLGSDDFGKRERATEVLSAGDASLVPALKAYLEKTEDVEVRKRLGQVIAAVEEVGFEKTFFQNANDVTDGGGEEIAVSNATADGTLEVTKGKITWVQKYDGKTVTQTYTFDPDTKLAVKGTREIKLKFDKMDSTDDNYNPDSLNPRLVAKNTPTGVRLILFTTDVNNMNNSVQFSLDKTKREPPPEPVAPEEEEEWEGEVVE